MCFTVALASLLGSGAAAEAASSQGWEAELQSAERGMGWEFWEEEQIEAINI